MSDNKNFNDEYQYVEESLNESNQEEQTTQVKEEVPQGINTFIQQPSVRRNASIAILGLFIMVAVIKCSSSPVLKKKKKKRLQHLKSLLRSQHQLLQPLHHNSATYQIQI